MRARTLLLVCHVVLVASCEDPPPEPGEDAGVDAGAECTPLGPFELTASDGVGEPLAAEPGTARAGRLAAGDLPDDPSGLLGWRAGDFVMSNGRVAFVVSDDESPGQIYDPHGGRVVGLGRVEGGAVVETGDYNLLLLALGRFTLATEEVAVLNDGSDGEPAVVRAAGTLTPIQALGDLVDGLVPGEFAGLPAVLDYTLAPDADRLDVVMRVRASAAGLRATLGSLQVFFQAYRTPAWRPGAGFAESMTATPYVAFDDADGTAFAWRGPGGANLDPLLATSGADIFRTGRLTVGACEEGTLELGSFVAAGPGLPAVQATLADLDGAATARVAGAVREADGTPAADARLHVLSADGEHLSRFFPAADGTFDVTLDARAAEIFAWREGAPLVGPVAVGEDVEVTMPAVGALRVAVTELASGEALPARVEVFPGSGEPPSVPEAYGEVLPGRGRVMLRSPPTGAVSLALAPGDYRVRVTRGPEYTRVDADVTVTAGAETPLDVTLERVVPTPGVLCADYHIHTSRSVDSSDAAADKVASLVGDGLEIAVRSDHEWVADFGPVVERLGLGDFAIGLTGLELTTFTYGHFGVFPLTVDPSRPSGGAVPWYDRDAPDVFDAVRARPEAPALIINHPRSGGVRQAYFTEAGYDPVTGTVARPELWDESFTVVEVFNSSDFERAREDVVVDWFSLLNAGRRVFAVGSSDSHELRSTPVGWPRTCLRLGADDVRAVTPDQIRDATNAGRSTISGGLYLELTGPGDTHPGDEATGVGERASLEARIFAAPHVGVDRLEVIVDGATVETIDVGPGDAIDAVERLRATLEVDVAADGSWVVLHASGSEPFDTDGHRPFVVSNPIFLTR